MAKTLDRRRDFGTVHGENAPFRFMQDGCYFDEAGCQVDGSGNRVASGNPVASPAPAAAPAATGQGDGDADPAAAALAERQRQLSEWAAKVLDAAMDKIVPDLPDFDEEQLAALKAGEQAGKTRKGLMAALDAEVARRANDAAGAQGAQVNAQLRGMAALDAEVARHANDAAGAHVNAHLHG